MVQLAKITPPSPSKIVLRKRLFRLLDSHRHQPVIWVSGPAGSGKTTLVASYLATGKFPTLWYQMDAGDTDVATFFYYLGLAVRKVAPRRRRSLPLLTPEYRHDIPTFSRRFFEQLFSRLAANSVLVFDNYQEVPRESPLHEVIREALAVIPKGIRIILISRQMPPPALIRFRANDLAGMVTWEDIRLDTNESFEIARLRIPRLSRQAVRRLHRIVDGWAAGLVLILERMRTKGIDFHAMESHPPEEIFDYFASEVFNHSAPELQEFLLKTAFLPKMTTDMAKRMTELNEAGEILATLNKNGYFTVEHGHQDPHYEYHPLFRSFLTTRAQQIFSAETLKHIQIQAAQILKSVGQTEVAVVLLQGVEEWKSLVSMIQEYAPSMVAQGRGQTLEQWLHSLPKELLNQHGWLPYWLGVCFSSKDLAKSRQLFEEAFELFHTLGDWTGQFSAWSGIVDSILYAWDDFSPLDHWISWLDSHLTPPVRLDTPDIEAAVITSMMGALTYRQPNHPKVGQWVREAERILLDDNSGWQLRMSVGSYLGTYYFWAHSLTLFRDIIQRLRLSASSLEQYPLSHVHYKWNDSNLEIFHGQSPVSCQKAAREGLRIAKTTGVHLLDFLLYSHMAIGSIGDGDLPSAGNYLDTMFRLIKGRYGQSYYYYLSSWHAYLSGNLTKAMIHAEQCLKLNHELGMPFTIGAAYHALAELLFESGRREAAYDQLAKACQVAETTGERSFLNFVCHLTEARFALGEGSKPSQASDLLTHLRKAMEIARKEGLMNFYWWVPPWMMSLCLKALEENIEVEYVQQLVRRRHLFPESPPYHCENWPWEVKVRVLGNFEVMREGKAINFQRKAPRKVILLLKALIACGAKGIHEENLASLLWPDSDGDIALKSLEVTLHRLRQFLGNQEVILLRDGQLSINAYFCWVDAHAFEDLLRRAEWSTQRRKTNFSPKGADSEEEYRVIEEAIGLYKGPFLEEVIDPWALLYRERLKKKFERAVCRLCEHFQEQGSVDLAIKLYERSLDADELAEQFYCGLMRCYQVKGRQTEALAVYRNCRIVLKNKLNVSPSPETEALRKSMEGG